MRSFLGGSDARVNSQVSVKKSDSCAEFKSERARCSQLLNKKCTPSQTFAPRASISRKKRKKLKKRKKVLNLWIGDKISLRSLGHETDRRRPPRAQAPAGFLSSQMSAALTNLTSTYLPGCLPLIRADLPQRKKNAK